MPEPPQVSVVVPVHNEALFLPEAFPLLVADLDATGFDYVVVLVENGSTDGTAGLVDEVAAHNARVSALHLDTPDYGAAMAAGFAAASGEWVVNFDIDYFSGEFLTAALSAMPQPDVVLASKRVTGAEDRRSPMRRIATWGFNVLLRIGFGSSLADTHGMKAIRSHIVEEIAPQVLSRQDLFDTELVLRAERAGYRILELPTTVEEQRPTGLGLLRRVPRTLVGLARLRWRLRRR
ncbi:MAG: glycosyltransferase [Acidimicrobiia bacterium]|nr:glycosyltransferase [Acidimicrobiia bacterium]